MSGKLLVIDAWSQEDANGRQTTTVSTDDAFVTIDRLTEPRGGKTTLTLVPFARGDNLDRLIEALRAARNYSGVTSLMTRAATADRAARLRRSLR
jgi:hypothetical protein